MSMMVSQITSLIIFLLNRLFRRRPKKTSMLCVTGFCEKNSPATGGFPAQRPSNPEKVPIWWRRHESIMFNTLRARQNCRHFQTFSSGFLWMKMHEFRLQFHWSLFLSSYFNIVSDNCLAPTRRQAIIWASDGIGYRRIYAGFKRHVFHPISNEAILSKWARLLSNKTGLIATNWHWPLTVKRIDPLNRLGCSIAI